jgi:CHAT domain-containing protein
LSLECQVARQLRTTYSPPPTVERRQAGPLKALVVGDPGNPRVGDSLPGARTEAFAVAEQLERKGVKVTLMVGAPSVAREGRLRDVRAASRVAVLHELMQGGYDLLHYAGHGDFDPEHPESTGWLFEGRAGNSDRELITARELERIDLAPRLVVANACLSALTSERLARGETIFAGKTEADLLPGLADEFFRRGVRNYIGTAWEVNDIGAVMFARRFYDTLIPDGPTANPPTMGESLLQARNALRDEERKFGALWAAYQHYGDPTQAFVTGEAVPTADAPAGNGRKGGARKKRSGRKSRRKGGTRPKRS